MPVLPRARRIGHLDWAAAVFLGQLGYPSFRWGLGENRGLGRHVTGGLQELLAAKQERDRAEAPLHPAARPAILRRLGT